MQEIAKAWPLRRSTSFKAVYGPDDICISSLNFRSENVFVKFDMDSLFGVAFKYAYPT